MNQNQVALVQRTWAEALAAAPTAGQVFYDNLFAADPTLRNLFKGNVEEQAKKLVGMLSVAIGKLGDVGSLLPTLRDLGKRHAGYGVLPEHYDTVGAAFLQTLEQALGSGFTTDVKEAWTTVYGELAHAMKAGANGWDSVET